MILKKSQRMARFKAIKRAAIKDDVDLAIVTLDEMAEMIAKEPFEIGKPCYIAADEHGRAWVHPTPDKDYDLVIEWSDS